MRNFSLVGLAILGAMSSASIALASPMCWGTLVGGTYIVSCSNLSNAKYACLATFDVSKGSTRQHLDAPFDVKPKSNGNASTVPTPFSGTDVQAQDFAYSCAAVLDGTTTANNGQGSGASATQMGAAAGSQPSQGTSSADRTNGENSGQAGSSGSDDGGDSSTVVVPPAPVSNSAQAQNQAKIADQLAPKQPQQAVSPNVQSQLPKPPPATQKSK